jgi:hypothetical protein
MLSKHLETKELRVSGSEIWRMKLTCPVTTLIVDDNWQTLDQMDNQGQKGMVRFEADKTCFPDGLQSTISKIKTENPGIKRVAVWHTMVRSSSFKDQANLSSWVTGEPFLRLESWLKSTKPSRHRISTVGSGLALHQRILEHSTTTFTRKCLCNSHKTLTISDSLHPAEWMASRQILKTRWTT